MTPEQEHALYKSCQKLELDLNAEMDFTNHCKFIKVTSDPFFGITYTISYKCPFTRLMQRLS